MFYFRYIHMEPHGNWDVLGPPHSCDRIIVHQMMLLLLKFGLTTGVSQTWHYFFFAVINQTRQNCNPATVKNLPINSAATIDFLPFSAQFLRTHPLHSVNLGQIWWISSIIAYIWLLKWISNKINFVSYFFIFPFILI